MAAAGASSSFTDDSEQFFASLLTPAIQNEDDDAEQVFDLNIKNLFDSIVTKTSNIKQTLRKQKPDEGPDDDIARALDESANSLDISQVTVVEKDEEDDLP